MIVTRSIEYKITFKVMSYSSKDGKVVPLHYAENMEPETLPEAIDLWKEASGDQPDVDWNVVAHIVVSQKADTVSCSYGQPEELPEA